ARFSATGAAERRKSSSAVRILTSAPCGQCVDTCLLQNELFPFVRGTGVLSTDAGNTHLAVLLPISSSIRWLCMIPMFVNHDGRSAMGLMMEPSHFELHRAI